MLGSYKVLPLAKTQTLPGLSIYVIIDAPIISLGNELEPA